ncbi:MAG: DUF1223 domain-containing protein [Acidobacteriaceae bacterium]
MRFEVALGLAALAFGSSLGVRREAPPVPAPQTTPAATAPATTAPPRAVLVELFTSEGCSSCPPADNLLRSIDGTRTDAGSVIVGVSEHVNYWDHDGWTDPFDSAEITDRQNQYGEKFHLPEVYTPQMVVNGETQVSGNDVHALVKAVQAAETKVGATVKILSATIDGRAVMADISVTGEIPKHGADVFAVVAQDETSDVTAGENKGKTLVNDSVARNLVRVEKIRDSGESKVRIPLPGGLHTTPASRRHLILWVQETNLGTVLGVDTKAF